LEVGAKGGVQLHLRQDPDPGKQNLKGAVRTKTYWRHYCQQNPFVWLIYTNKNFKRRNEVCEINN
jgi:hypothetical protein